MPTIQDLQALMGPPKILIPVRIGSTDYYTAAQLAEVFGIPEWYFIDRCRRGQFGGAKLGKVYIISAEQFKEFVEGDNFHYTPRVRGKAPR